MKKIFLVNIALEKNKYLWLYSYLLMAIKIFDYSERLGNSEPLLLKTIIQFFSVATLAFALLID